MPPAEEATQTQEADAQAPQPSEPDPTSNPPEKDWKEEYARLRKEFDDKSKRLKELEPKKKPESEDIDFKIENAGRIKLVKEEYKTYKEKGYSNTDALRLAELDKGITTSSPEAERQAGSASAPGTVNRTIEGDEPKLSDTDKRLGIKPDTVKKYRHLVEG